MVSVMCFSTIIVSYVPGVFAAVHAREYMRLLQSEARVYPIVSHSMCSTVQGVTYRVRYDVSAVRAHRGEDVSLCPETTTAGVCDRFVAPTTEYFGYHMFGGSSSEGIMYLELMVLQVIISRYRHPTFWS